MHKNLSHAQRIGHQTSVLTSRAAKTLQGIACHVITARDRYFFDGIGHLLNRNVDEALGHLGGWAAARGLRMGTC